MKTISVLVPTYNEEGNIDRFIGRLAEMFGQDLPEYDYEILIIDNCSTDGTRAIVESHCAKNPRVKAIYNIKNFGSLRSGFYGLTQTTGDCVVKIAADFQEPIETIPKFVRAWEEGYPIVIGVKHKSKEGKLKFLMRSCYYRLIKKISNVEQIEHFTGFGLYDKSFIDVCRNLHDPYPYFRGIVSEFGGKRKEIEYIQEKRTAGKSKYNFLALYDYGMLGITSYTKILLRLATIAGFIISLLSIVGAVIFAILKFIYWDRYSAGIVPLIILMLLLSSIQLIFIGLMGEYILNINTRVLDRPLVIEEKRINI